MPVHHFSNPAHKCVITRIVTEEEVEKLRARLVELECRDIVFFVDGDGGTLWSCTVGSETFHANIIVNHWNPANSILIQISGPDYTAVASVISSIWPKDLYLETLLDHGSASGDTGWIE